MLSVIVQGCNGSCRIQQFFLHLQVFLLLFFHFVDEFSAISLLFKAILSFLPLWIQKHIMLVVLQNLPLLDVNSISFLFRIIFCCYKKSSNRYLSVILGTFKTSGTDYERKDSQ